MSMIAFGYGVTDQTDALLVDTVSSTERAAMVNWLVVECKCGISKHHTDEQIRHMFSVLSEQRGHELHKLRIEVLQ